MRPTTPPIAARATVPTAGNVSRGHERSRDHRREPDDLEDERDAEDRRSPARPATAEVAGTERDGGREAEDDDGEVRARGVSRGPALRRGPRPLVGSSRSSTSVGPLSATTASADAS